MADTVFGIIFVPGVVTGLLRNNGTAGRRLNAVEEANGTVEVAFAGVIAKFRGRNGLMIGALLEVRCFLGVFTFDGVRVLCDEKS